MKDTYIDLEFNVTYRAGAHAQYADGDHGRLVNLGPIALFNKYRLQALVEKRWKKLTMLMLFV